MNGPGAEDSYYSRRDVRRRPASAGEVSRGHVDYLGLSRRYWLISTRS